MSELLPSGGSFAIEPLASAMIAFEVAVLITIAPLKQFQQRVAKRRIHAHSFARQIAPDLVT